MEINEFIRMMRESDNYISVIYTQGGCFKFAEILKGLYGGEIYMNQTKSHVALHLDGSNYDIEGELEAKESSPETIFSPMSKMELIMAMQWRFDKSKYLKAGECEFCEEPFVIPQSVKATHG